MTQPPPTLAEGPWGGEQVVLTVEPARAVLRLGCAEGAFPAPVRLDAGGRFSLRGTYTLFGGGPSGAPEPAAAATFEGLVDGEQLTLTVRYGGAADRYVLTRGLQAKVIRCL